MFSAEATYQQNAAPLLTRLNRGLFRRDIEARFLTGFYGMLGPDGSLTYSNGGHNAPMLVKKDGVRRLETGGVVLGLFEHAAFDEETLSLQSRRRHRRLQRRRQRGDQRGGRRVHRRAPAGVDRAHRSKPPQELLDALLADVRAFCGQATPNDDVTMVIVRYDGYR